MPPVSRGLSPPPQSQPRSLAPHSPTGGVGGLIPRPMSQLPITARGPVPCRPFSGSARPPLASTALGGVSCP